MQNVVFHVSSNMDDDHANDCGQDDRYENGDQSLWLDEQIAKMRRHFEVLNAQAERIAILALHERWQWPWYRRGRRIVPSTFLGRWWGVVEVRMRTQVLRVKHGIGAHRRSWHVGRGPTLTVDRRPRRIVSKHGQKDQSNDLSLPMNIIPTYHRLVIDALLAVRRQSVCISICQHHITTWQNVNSVSTCIRTNVNQYAVEISPILGLAFSSVKSVESRKKSIDVRLVMFGCWFAKRPLVTRTIHVNEVRRNECDDNDHTAHDGL